MTWYWPGSPKNVVGLGLFRQVAVAEIPTIRQIDRRAVDARLGQAFDPERNRAFKGRHLGSVLDADGADGDGPGPPDREVAGQMPGRQRDLVTAGPLVNILDLIAGDRRGAVAEVPEALGLLAVVRQQAGAAGDGKFRRALEGTDLGIDLDEFRDDHGSLIALDGRRSLIAEDLQAIGAGPPVNVLDFRRLARGCRRRNPRSSGRPAPNRRRRNKTRNDGSAHAG